MNNVKSALTRKFGPLPAWAWAGILGVALYLYRRRSSTAAASTADQQQATVGYYGPYGQNAYPIQGGAGTGGDQGFGGGSDTGSASAPATTTTDTPPPPTINVFPSAPAPNVRAPLVTRPKRVQKPKQQHAPAKPKGKAPTTHRSNPHKSTKARPHTPVKRSNTHVHNGAHSRHAATQPKPAKRVRH